MDPRNVPLHDGDSGWLFGALATDEERASITGLLLEADDLVYRAGQAFGDDPDARIADTPLNRFYYQRLGPGPDMPTAVLMAEGGTDPIRTTIVCAPRDPRHPERGGPILHQGPPWRIDAWITLQCDVDPRTCSGHEVIAWRGASVGSATDAARHIRAAAAWMLEVASSEHVDSLRARDTQRGHAPIAARSD
jgi:hypothetical protein